MEKKSNRRIIPGINVQWPWSEYLISGKKKIETRSYPIPEKYTNRELAIIQTPGKKLISESGKNTAKIIGTIVFSNCYPYTDEQHWKRESNQHLVHPNDPLFGYHEAKPKWAWVVKTVNKFKTPLPAPRKRGIVYSSSCIIHES